MRWSITGTTTSAVQPCCAIALSVSSGSNLRRMTSVVLSAMPEREVREAPGVEHRGGEHRVLAGAQRDHAEQRGRGVERLGLAALGPLRAAGRAAREDHDAALLGRRLEVGRVAVADEVLEARVLGGLVGVVPRDEPRAAPARVVDEVLELGVVDDRRRLLALGDLGDLRAGERGVQVQRVGAELRQRDGRVDEAAVVAAHDRDARALPHPAGAQGVGQRVRALGDLGERERPEVVDERRRVRVADRADGVARGRRGAEAAQRAQRLDDPVRARRRHDPGARQRAGREEFLPDPVLGGHGTET